MATARMKCDKIIYRPWVLLKTTELCAYVFVKDSDMKKHIRFIPYNNVHVKKTLPVTHCGSVSQPENRHLMTRHPIIPKPTLQVYDAVDPSSVLEYTAAGAFTTTCGGPQSVIKET